MFSRVLNPKNFAIFFLIISIGISSVASASVKGDPTDQEVVLETTVSTVPDQDENSGQGCQIRVSCSFSYFFSSIFPGFFSSTPEPKANRVEILPETEQTLPEAEGETKVLETQDDGLGALASLPLEVRRMIYSQLDHRSLGNLELASQTLNIEIDQQNLWTKIAERMINENRALMPVAQDGVDLGEALSKQWIKKTIIREMSQRVLASPEGHGIQTHTLFLTQENFSGKGLQNGDFVRANFKGTSFIQARLESANFPFAVLDFSRFCHADLAEANLDGASFCHADLSGANMMSVQMRTTILQNAKMNEVNLTSADVRDADFSGANLENAKLEMAVISGTNFNGANLKGTILTRKVLISSGCRFDSKTQFSWNQ